MPTPTHDHDDRGRQAGDAERPAAACSSRLSTSRPNSSVPSGCAALEPARRAVASMAVGSCGLRSDGRNAASTSRTTSASPTTASGSRNNAPAKAGAPAPPGRRAHPARPPVAALLPSATPSPRTGSPLRKDVPSSPCNRPSTKRAVLHDERIVQPVRLPELLQLRLTRRLVHLPVQDELRRVPRGEPGRRERRERDAQPRRYQ